MKNTLFICLLGIALFSSCKKEVAATTPALTNATVNSTVVTGNWRVTYYFDSNQDETSIFTGYQFIFAGTGVVTASKTGSTVNGTWTSGNDDSQVKLVLAFSIPANFSKLNNDWHVVERTDTKIVLQDVSGGNGGIDYLTFERN